MRWRDILGALGWAAVLVLAYLVVVVVLIGLAIAIRGGRV